MAGIEMTTLSPRTDEPERDEDLPVGHIRQRRKRFLSLADKYTFSPPIETFNDVRDYYALERTYLAYVRTSNVFVNYGIFVGQLFIIHQGRSTLGKVCSVVMSVCGIATVLLGAVRHFRQDKAFRDNSHCPKGQAISESRNIYIVATMTLCVVIGLFVVIMVYA